MPPSTPDVRECSPMAHPRRYLHTQMARQTPQNHRYIDVARGTLVRASLSLLSPMRVLSLLSLLVKSALLDLDQDLDLPFESPCRIKSTTKKTTERKLTKDAAKDTSSKTNILNPEKIIVWKVISFRGDFQLPSPFVFAGWKKPKDFLCLASAGTSATSAIATLGLTISYSLNRWGKMHPDDIYFFMFFGSGSSSQWGNWVIPKHQL